MSSRPSQIIAALLLSAAPLHAEDSPKPEAVPAYELKKRSEFPKVAADARAPFWPIGWVKRKAGVAAGPSATSVVPRAQLDGKSFKVTSILLGTGSTPSLAVINGRAYSEGEFLRTPRGATPPPTRIRVQRINDGTVILQNADQILVASLQRPELLERKAEELLFDPDR